MREFSPAQAMTFGKSKENAGLIVLFVLVALALPGRCDPFINLDFEAANTSSVANGEAPTADLVPGWQVFYGKDELALIGYNSSNFSLFNFASLIGPALGSFGQDISAIQGKYSLGFMTRDIGPGTIEYSIFQRGDVPSDARSLEFTFFENPFVVSINGFDLARPDPNPASPVSGRRLAFDVTPFAGQNVELKFTTTPTATLLPGPHMLDDIRFSTLVAPIPEPSTFSLLGLGFIAWCMLGRRR